MSGIGRQSTRTPRSSMPSCRTRTPPASASSSIGRPISVSTSRTCASGWSISVPSVVRIPRKRTSDGCSALAARPNAAEPMSGGRTISVGVASWPGSISKRRQSSETPTSSPKSRIMRTVSST